MVRLSNILVRRRLIVLSVLAQESALIVRVKNKLYAQFVMEIWNVFHVVPQENTPVSIVKEMGNAQNVAMVRIIVMNAKEVEEFIARIVMEVEIILMKSAIDVVEQVNISGERLALFVMVVEDL